MDRKNRTAVMSWRASGSAKRARGRRTPEMDGDEKRHSTKAGRPEFVGGVALSLEEITDQIKFFDELSIAAPGARRKTLPILPSDCIIIEHEDD